MEQNEQEMLEELQKLAQQSKLEEQILKDYQQKLAGLRHEQFLQDKNQIDIKNQIQNLRQQIMDLENKRRFRDIILEIIHRPSMLSL